MLWHLMFRVESEKKALHQLQRVSAALGNELNGIECKRYWKIPELWECDAQSALRPGSVTDLITASLLQANCLARGWYVLGPYFNGGGELESFSGIFNLKSGSRATATSLEWAHFELDVEAASPAGRGRTARGSTL